MVLNRPGTLPAELLNGVSKRLVHRGPDDEGVLSFGRGKVQRSRSFDKDPEAEAILLFRRLSILDLSERGWQPMQSPDERYYIIFNGEVYNYIELREELETLGHAFRSSSDTEVVLAAYAEWGANALKRFVGMFGLAILDVRDRKLFLARDFFGIKPLYYTFWRDGLVFASEIGAFLHLPGVDRSIHPQRVYDYLRFGYTDHGSGTLFQHIRQLPAAHYMEVSLDGAVATEPTRYWRMDLSRTADLSFDEAADRLRDLFLESVRLHLRSDVPVGAALSGGIDSSSIVMAMRRHEPDLELHGFSYVADDPNLSEERWIDLVVAEANVTVHKVHPSPDDLLADLNQLVDVQGECFGSTRIYAQLRIFKKTQEAGIKVMLDGQGADELLGGYRYYIAARLASLLRQGKWGQAGQLLQGAARIPRVGRLWCGLRAADYLLPASLQGPVRRLVGRELMPSWLNSRWFTERGVQVRNSGSRKGRSVLRETLHDTVVDSSLPHLLRYEDRNSMAFSIESRVPFLTPDLADFMFSLPEEYLIAPDGTTKAVFRKAMRGIVPDAILDRKDKIGFATPERNWLMTLRPWVEELLNGDTVKRMGFIDSAEIQKEWSRVMNGRGEFEFRVWRWVNMIRWVRQFDARTE